MASASIPVRPDLGAESSRPYHSRKRERPCDRCREQKLKCERDADDQTPCRRCRRTGAQCTFVGRPRKRASAKASGRVMGTPLAVPAQAPISPAIETRLAESSPGMGSLTESVSRGQLDTGGPYDSFSLALGDSSVASLHHHRPTTQISQTVDQIEGHNAMLLGSSSVSDPWLLRHFRFDELGKCSFHKSHIRNAGGVPTFDKIPVHFLLSADELSASTADEARASKIMELRERLNVLVPPSMGQRLIRVFHHQVFPNSPVLSRTDLGLLSSDSVPDLRVLSMMPLHLLAAVYGSALPFISSDDELTVLLTYDHIPLDEVWEIAYSCIQDEMHKPRLSVLQSALLYLHKKSQNHRQYATIDTAFIWPFMGTIVGLAYNIGLHIECRMMGIPSKEKRLRRRIWWAVYVEDKFLSLLMGRPPYIRQDEWDVSRLDQADFHPYALEQSGAAFQDMASLATIADTLQSSLYSLKSCQKLAEDLPASIQAARPIFDALNAWRASISAPENYGIEHATSISNTDTYPACVYFVYLTLMAYVWRALLRPTVRSLPPPQIIDVDQDPQTFPDTSFLFENLTWDFADLPEMELHLDDDVSDTSATIKELNQAAQTWAANLLTFTANLSSRDFGGFWYSWTRFGFVVASNFLMVLLVQAPTSENALKAKQMLEKWRNVLRDQSRGSPILILAFTQLTGFYLAGISETFCLPTHVQEVI